MFLSDARAKALKPGPKDQYVADGGTLYLRIRSTGTKSWVVRRKAGGHTVVTTLGRYPAMSLRIARQKLRTLDPRAAACALTLGEFLEQWFHDDIRERYRRPEHVQGYLQRFASEERLLWAAKLQDVEHLAVFQALKRYAKRHGPIAANRLTSIIKTAFRYAVNAGYLSSSPITALTTTIVGGPDRPRERVLSGDEIRAVWSSPGRHASLLKFLLVTGQRIGETQLAQWPQVAADTWSIPPDHTKNGRAHWVPLSLLAKEILATLDVSRRRVFGMTSTTAVQSWLKRWCKRQGISPAFTPHDLRRTFTTRLNELGVAPHVVEKMLNHQMQGVMAVYNRAEYAQERRDAASRWDVELRRTLTQED